YAGVAYQSKAPEGLLVYYGELASHYGPTALSGTYGSDIFHTKDARAFCKLAPSHKFDDFTNAYADAINTGTTAGGTVKNSTVKSLYIGRIVGAISTGGDTNPELFVGGFGDPRIDIAGYTFSTEVHTAGQDGAYIPELLVLVNGKRKAATWWSFTDDGPGIYRYTDKNDVDIWIGQKIPADTSWNVSDMYFVNNWPGTPLTMHKPDGNDTTNRFVTQVNYVSGYVCVASLD
ncbi:hypothetical protein LBY17_004717, partial [Salmonella enterica]|nr:hypothetical protein [Salmonella enterica]EJH5865097.1 hypothetical protein [Salmonella enterica]